MAEPIRINKYLSENGYCSRREADRLVTSGNVFINGRRAELGDKVDDRDTIRVQGRDRTVRPTYTYILANKPMGTSIDALSDFGDRVVPVDRLETNMEGLVLLTNDPVLAPRVSHPRYAFDKEYVVEVDRHVTLSAVKQLQNGVKIKGGMTKPAQVRKMDEGRFAIVLQEDRPHLIEQMCEAVGFNVVLIKRTRLLSLKMASTYPAGNWRHLTELEVHQLKKAAEPR